MFAVLWGQLIAKAAPFHNLPEGDTPHPLDSDAVYFPLVDRYFAPTRMSKDDQGEAADVEVSSRLRDLARAGHDRWLGPQVTIHRHPTTASLAWSGDPPVEDIAHELWPRSYDPRHHVARYVRARLTGFDHARAADLAEVPVRRGRRGAFYHAALDSAFEHGLLNHNLHNWNERVGDHLDQRLLHHIDSGGADLARAPLQLHVDLPRELQIAPVADPDHPVHRKVGEWHRHAVAQTLRHLHRHGVLHPDARVRSVIDVSPVAHEEYLRALGYQIDENGLISGGNEQGRHNRDVVDRTLGDFVSKRTARITNERNPISRHYIRYWRAGELL